MLDELNDSRSDAAGRPTERHLLTRRTILRYSLLSAAVMSVVAACQQAAAPSPTAAPAAAPTSPSAAKPTSPPAAAGTQAPAAQAAPSFNKAKIDGKFAIIQSRDFFPDHNTLVEQKIKEFAEKQGYPLEHSYIEAFAGAGNVVQKLTAAVQAGDAPDILIHNLSPQQLHFLEIVEDVSVLHDDLAKQHGKTAPAITRRTFIDNKWWAIPHFSRSSGYWVRESVWQAAGLDYRKELETWDSTREALLKISNPDKNMWGWGVSANRSGDGARTVQDAINTRGGALADEKGEIVVLNKEPYRQAAIDGLTYLKEVYTDPKWAKMLPPGVTAWTDPSNNEAWLAGTIPWTANAGTLFAESVFKGNPVAEDSALSLTPHGPGPNDKSLNTGAGGSMNLFIMKGAKNREAAEQLIRYLMSPEIYKQMFKISQGYVYPAAEWGWDEQEIKESKYAQKVTPTWKQIVMDPAAYSGADWMGPPTAWTAALDSQNFFTDMFGEVLGGKSPADAVKSAHDRAVRVAKEFGAKGE
jgi:multiple sugar transport system substrate-binding protein